MRVEELLITAFESLKINRKRSFLTIIGIAIGIASVVTILGIGDGVKKTMYDKFAHDSTEKYQTAKIYYTTGEESAMDGFTQEDVTKVETMFPQVKKAYLAHETDDLNLSGTVGEKQGTYTVSLINKNSAQAKLVCGKKFDRTVLLGGDHQALISEALAKRQYHSAYKALGTAVNIDHRNYQVVGVYRQHDVYDESGSIDKYGADIILAKAVYYGGKEMTSGNSLKVKMDVSAKQAAKLATKIKKYLNKHGSAKNNGSYEYDNMEQMLKQFNATIDIFTGVIAFVAGISLFIAGIGVMNMMYISVSERTQEIGIRLAVGASQQNIMWQFLIEAMMLTVFGGMIGFIFGGLLSHLITPLLSQAMVTGITIKAHISLKAFMISFGVSAGIGLIFGILPARQAAKKNLVDILK